MTDFELKANAMLNELATQRNAMADRAMYLAADLALANAKIKALEAKVAELEKPKAESLP